MVLYKFLIIKLQLTSSAGYIVSYARVNVESVFPASVYLFGFKESCGLWDLSSTLRSVQLRYINVAQEAHYAGNVECCWSSAVCVFYFSCDFVKKRILLFMLLEASVSS